MYANDIENSPKALECDVIFLYEPSTRCILDSICCPTLNLSNVLPSQEYILGEGGKQKMGEFMRRAVAYNSVVNEHLTPLQDIFFGKV